MEKVAKCLEHYARSPNLIRDTDIKIMANNLTVQSAHE